MAGRHRVRRSENLPVRRWLQAGAASVGMGAAMWGMTLVGPQIGVAVADNAGPASSSAGSPSDAGTTTSDTKEAKAAGAKGGQSGPAKSGSRHDKGTNSSSKDSGSKSDSDDTEDAESLSNADETSNPSASTAKKTKSSAGAVKKSKSSAAAEKEGTSDSRGGSDVDDESEGTVDHADAQSVTPSRTSPTTAAVSNLVPSPTAAASTQSVAAAVAVNRDDESGREIHPWGTKQEANEANKWQQNTSDIIAATTANFDLIIKSLALPPEIRGALSGTLWTMRRTFFNLAPTMNQTFSVTSGDGEISGLAAATDPEGDRIVYRVVQGPRYGSVELNADGSYIYTPTGGFDGVDTFVIAARDTGAHINLFEPFRSAGASTGILVNKDAIAFDFQYNDPDGLFTDERKEALNQSAKRLTAYFIVNQKTVLTYTVNSVNITDGFLASAGSGISNKEDPGFWGTVVQEKLQSGVDTNGAAADGEINWNWAYDWGLYPSVKPTEYDFTSTVMHELLHSFGWLNYISRPPDLRQDIWFTYDQFVTTKNGDSPINRDTFKWDPAYNDYLTGYDGGLYLTGENAVAGFGGRPVPLYTPEEWSDGSSVGHLRDDVFSGPNHAMMDHAAAGMGPDDITLNPAEVGVLMDLGYIVVANPWFAYPMLPKDPNPPVESMGPKTTNAIAV